MVRLWVNSALVFLLEIGSRAIVKSKVGRGWHSQAELESTVTEMRLLGGPFHTPVCKPIGKSCCVPTWLCTGLQPPLYDDMGRGHWTTKGLA